MNKNKLNLRNVAYNRFDDGNPKEIWVTEGQDVLTVKPKYSDYDFEIFTAIQSAIDKGIINTNSSLSLSEGTDITITGTGTQEDPYIINYVGTSGDSNVNADWDAVSGDAEILNKPTIPTLTSQLTNDSGFITEDNQTASEVDVVPTGNLSSNNVQDALNELQTDINALNANDHAAASSGNPNIEVDGAQRISVVISPDADNALASRVNGLYVPQATGDVHAKQMSGTAMLHCKPTTTTYTVSNGVGSLVIAEFGDISHASIIVNKTTDALNGNFTLDIDFQDDSVNTWDVSGGANYTLQDLYVPQFHIYNVGAVDLMSASLSDKTSDQTSGIFPANITWANGILSINFTNGSTFDNITKMLIELNFPKLK